MNDFDVVGKSYPQIDGLETAMGKTKFVSDLVLPNISMAVSLEVLMLMPVSDTSILPERSCVLELRPL
jgi:hypothetical protein